jgi:hypothetical protein
MNIYHKVTDTESGLSVSIDRNGIAIKEITPVAGMMDDPEGDYLITEGRFSWEQYRGRTRSYAGDDGQGRMRDRLVAGAISLLAYWGGEESWSDDLGDFDEIA